MQHQAAQGEIDDVAAGHVEDLERGVSDKPMDDETGVAPAVNNSASGNAEDSAMEVGGSSLPPIEDVRQQ